MNFALLLYSSREENFTASASTCIKVSRYAPQIPSYHKTFDSTATIPLPVNLRPPKHPCSESAYPHSSSAPMAEYRPEHPVLNPAPLDDQNCWHPQASAIFGFTEVMRKRLEQALDRVMEGKGAYVERSPNRGAYLVFKTRMVMFFASLCK